MSTSKQASVRRSGSVRRSVVYSVLTSFLATSSLPSQAALTQLDSKPIASTTSAQVKPNIMFILDTSGSMALLHLPDGLDSGTIGYKNFRCNLMYYNPATNYAPPKKPDGTNFTGTTFTSAYSNGFQNYPGAPTSTPTNLSSGFRAYSFDSSQAAYYYNYIGSQTLVPLAGDCLDTSVGSNWVKVVVGATSGPDGADERENFARWYSYYRSRILTMKSAASRAFNELTDSYRMGLIVINPKERGPTSSVDPEDYLKIDDYTSTHKADWYAKLFGMSVGDGTPLREGLARVGRHYAGQTDGINAGMTPDPVQYSCQQNFAILTTDGFWNTSGETAGKGPVMIDGSTQVGSQDGDLSITPRPMWDGGISGSSVETDKENLYAYAVCNIPTPQMRTIQHQRRSVQNQQRSSDFQVTYSQLQRCPNSRWNGSDCVPASFWADRLNASDTSRTREDPVLRVKSAPSCPPLGVRDSEGQTPTACSGGASFTPWVDVISCAASPGVECQQINDTGLVNVDTCTPSTGSTGPTVTCSIASDSDWVNVASCTASNPAPSGPTVTCQDASAGGGQKIQYQTTTYTTTAATSGGIAIGTPTTVVTGPTAPADLDGVCYPDGAGTLPLLPNPNPQRPVPPGFDPAPPAGCGQWPCTATTTSPSGSTSDTLADVAQYYYNTDLRPPGSKAADGITDVSQDNVPSSGKGPEDDKASWQHMTTFTMGLGLSGELAYRPDYKTASTGDFADLRSGAKGWTVPVSNTATTIDDLWHTAVNGRGTYFSAGDPETVVSGLQSALAGINARVASAAAAATSNLEPVAGDNFAYTAQYTTQKWTGELEAHAIDLDTGVVGSTVIWSAQVLLDSKVKDACDDRTIYLFRAGATKNRVPFTWNTKACDASGLPTGAAQSDLDPTTEQIYFNAARVALLSHYPSMTDGTSSTANQRGAAPGKNLVNFLRGQKGKQGFVANDINKLYRTRENALGDIVSAQPVFVKKPFASYGDAGYSTYKATNPPRDPMVYVAANDGMLHGFDADTGVEKWAFIPSLVLPELYKLADNNYANNHVYSVDGTPSAGDIYDTVAGTWKTILVAGLNRGGQGYYALDVTDPDDPKGLWEFQHGSTCQSAAPGPGAKSDCALGYTYGNPVITKLANDQWVVMVTSGYNNVTDGGDGKGYLYVLDAVSGEIIYKISTGVGSTGDPSGLSHIANWVDDTTVDNKTLRVYGGDLVGNIWRFDINDTIAPAGREATLIGTAKDPTGGAQAITTRPELAEVAGKPMVFVASGKLLSATDIGDTQQNSIWGIIDPLTETSPAYADLRLALKPLEMTKVGGDSGTTRTIECTGTNAECNSPNGWVADLLDSGERVTVDMKLQLGTLVVASNVPQISACNIGGFSWLNFLDFATGTAVSNAPGNIVSQKLSDALVVGLNIVRLPNGKTVVITTTSDAKQTTISAPFAVPPPAGKRVSWREISQ